MREISLTRSASLTIPSAVSPGDERVIERSAVAILLGACLTLVGTRPARGAPLAYVQSETAADTSERTRGKSSRTFPRLGDQAVLRSPRSRWQLSTLCEELNAQSPAPYALSAH